MYFFLSFETISHIQKNYQYITKTFFPEPCESKLLIWGVRWTTLRAPLHPWNWERQGLALGSGLGGEVTEWDGLHFETGAPGCQSCCGAEMNPADGSQTGSPWEALLLAGCLGRPGDHRRERACRKQGPRAVHQPPASWRRHCPPQGASLCVSSSWRRERLQKKRGKSARGFCATQGPALSYNCPRRAGALMPLTSFSLPQPAAQEEPDAPPAPAPPRRRPALSRSQLGQEESWMRLCAEQTCLLNVTSGLFIVVINDWKSSRTCPRLHSGAEKNRLRDPVWRGGDGKQ